MKVLQNDYILKTLDLPTVEWNQFYDDCKLTPKLLWTIKVEDVPKSSTKQETTAKKKSLLSFLREKKLKEQELIGVDAATAQLFGEKKVKQIDPKRQVVIYYPYYTAVKSGILDINNNRIVIEGMYGDISSMIAGDQADVTMIFEDDDLKIVGDERFFTTEEILPVIDHAREIKKMATTDLDQKKNIQLYFSYVYQTNEMRNPEGELQLCYHRFKLF